MLSRADQIIGPVAAVFALAWMLRTAGVLVGVIRRLVAGDGPAGEVVRIFRFRNTADGPLVDGFGLTFVGWGGVGLASLQIGLLVSAAISGFVPSPRFRRVRAALMLGGICVGLIWAGSATWLLLWSFDVFSLVLTMGHVAGLLGMCLAMRWRLRAVGRPA